MQYTPRYAILPIIKYLKQGATIWCPFDTEDSLFVKMFRERGFNVIIGHKDTGQDFFNIDTPECDYIISNPPYSLKERILQRLFSINKPFAMLVGVVGLFESQIRFNMFASNEFEVLYINKRIAYFKDYKEQIPSVNPPFSSVYICHKVLPKQICFEEIIK